MNHTGGENFRFFRLFLYWRNFQKFPRTIISESNRCSVRFRFVNDPGQQNDQHANSNRLFYPCKPRRMEHIRSNKGIVSSVNKRSDINPWKLLFLFSSTLQAHKTMTIRWNSNKKPVNLQTLVEKIKNLLLGSKCELRFVIEQSRLFFLVSFCISRQKAKLFHYE